MNAVQRFIRSRVLLLTASILIVAMCLSVLVQGQSQAALNRTVDQNSRGLYDVLVQAKAEDNGGLMQPEIATGQGGISFEQLDAIRKLSGTSVAAPDQPRSRASPRTWSRRGWTPPTTSASTPASPAPQGTRPPRIRASGRPRNRS